MTQSVAGLPATPIAASDPEFAGGLRLRMSPCTAPLWHCLYICLAHASVCRPKLSQVELQALPCHGEQTQMTIRLATRPHQDTWAFQPRHGHNADLHLGRAWCFIATRPRQVVANPVLAELDHRNALCGLFERTLRRRNGLQQPKRQAVNKLLSAAVRLWWLPPPKTRPWPSRPHR